MMYFRPYRRHEHGQHHLDHVIRAFGQGDGRNASLSFVHLRKGLPDAEIIFAQQDDHFRFGVIARVMIGEKRKSLPVVSPETGGVVGDALPDQQKREPFKQLDSNPAGKRGFKSIMVLS